MIEHTLYEYRCVFNLLHNKKALTEVRASEQQLS
jgi:hypothetical protein